MFVFSFKASRLVLVSLVCVCIVAAVGIICFLPDAGSGLNVNKLDISKELSQINAKKAEGRIEYLSLLGYEVKDEPVASSDERLSKVFDAVTENYNKLQRMQGFDLQKYAGKKLKGYTYEVEKFPDGTEPGGDKYLATLIVYKNKVVAADVCCPERREYFPLVNVA